MNIKQWVMNLRLNCKDCIKNRPTEDNNPDVLFAGGTNEKYGTSILNRGIIIIYPSFIHTSISAKGTQSDNAVTATDMIYTLSSLYIKHFSLLPHINVIYLLLHIAIECYPPTKRSFEIRCR